MKSTLLRGVPPSLQQDGWWLSGDIARVRKSKSPEQARRMPAQALVLIALIVLADMLVWQVVPGLSLAVFCAAVVAGALALRPCGVNRRLLARVAGGTLLAVMPLVELVQPLSLGVAIVGLTLIFCMVAGVRTRALGQAALMFWPAAIQRGLRDLRQCSHPTKHFQGRAFLIWFLRRWAMPLGVGAVFSSLLFAANPLAQAFMTKLTQVDWTPTDTQRVVFWCILAQVLWIVLGTPHLRGQLRPVQTSPVLWDPESTAGWINTASTVRALILFNGIFAIQTLMDLVFLYAGIGLPEGVTYAEYAHRGAYPLVITALLAGGFALLCQPWVQGAPLLRALLLVWVAQNVALAIGSEVRLALYVEAYGLTRLRLSAAIWMALVVVGLIMIMWQICANRSNGWLLVRLTALGAGVLYLCTWVSFDATIARFNLGQATIPDRAYLCQLGAGAQPHIAAYDAVRSTTLCRWPASVDLPYDWREWGFRNWRARHSLNAIQIGAAP